MKALCANGMVGVDTATGKLYNVRYPCKNPRVPGHTMCDKCREESGGLPKTRVESPLRSNAHIQ